MDYFFLIILFYLKKSPTSLLSEKIQASKLTYHFHVADSNIYYILELDVLFKWHWEPGDCS